jgi:hypothetical protein
VCQQWHTIIFASQHRLDLQLLCTAMTSVKQTLDLWPAFPITVRNISSLSNWDNIIATLQQCDRVCEIDLILLGPESNKVSQVMQEPFPLLDRLTLQVCGAIACTSTFLGGSAPRLRFLHLDVFRFKEFKLPQILSSASHLCELRLQRVESTNCISPAALVAALSTMSRLKNFYLHFLNETSRNVSPPFSGRIDSSLLSSLIRLTFHGPRNYLEDFLRRIDTPYLEFTHVTFFKSSSRSFDVSQLSQFLGRLKSRSLPDWAGVRQSSAVSSIYFSLTRTVALPGGRLKVSEWLRVELPLWSPFENSLMTQIPLPLKRAKPSLLHVDRHMVL